MTVLSVATYIYFLFYYVSPTIATTPIQKQLSSNKSHEILKGNSSDLTDFRLTKLLDVRMGGKSEPINYFQALLRDDVIKALNGSSKGTGGLADGILYPDDIQPLRTERSRPSPGKDTILVLLDSLSREIQGIRSSLKTLNSDIADLKGNQSCKIEKSVCQPNNVGVNYDSDKVIKTKSKSPPKNCKEVQENGYNVSGIYEIRPRYAERPFMVLCDMDTDGGGWTHIQNRFDGSQDFYLEWRDYKFGFGNLEREFWLGLENIYLLTAFELNELLVDIVDRDNKKATAKYSTFGVASETNGYKLNVLSGYSGDAGDSLTHHLGEKFSTKDFDQDSYDKNCAELFKGGWWYKACHISNLNGKYINVDLPKAYEFQGLHWKTYRSHEYCHSKSRMMIRPTHK